jgi:hypothetical protein
MPNHDNSVVMMPMVAVVAGSHNNGVGHGGG